MYGLLVKGQKVPQNVFHVFSLYLNLNFMFVI
jgi:hypothetical protein